MKRQLWSFALSEPGFSPGKERDSLYSGFSCGIDLSPCPFFLDSLHSVRSSSTGATQEVQTRFCLPNGALLLLPIRLLPKPNTVSIVRHAMKLKPERAALQYDDVLQASIGQLPELSNYSFCRVSYFASRVVCLPPLLRQAAVAPSSFQNTVEGASGAKSPFRSRESNALSQQT